MMKRRSWLLGVVALVIVLNPLLVIAQEGDSRYLGQWAGFWTQSEWRGTAALTVRRDRAGILAADFVLSGTGSGIKSFTLPASVEDGTLVMKTSRSTTRLNLVGDTLSGVYEITAGNFEGEMGNYSLKRR